MCLLELFYTRSLLDLRFLQRPVRSLVHYMRARWGSTCPIEETAVGLPTCDKANVGQRHRPDGMCLQKMIINRLQSMPTDHVCTPLTFV
jgi:hypothetical protein